LSVEVFFVPYSTKGYFLSLVLSEPKEYPSRAFYNGIQINPLFLLSSPLFYALLTVYILYLACWLPLFRKIQPILWYHSTALCII